MSATATVTVQVTAPAANRPPTVAFSQTQVEVASGTALTITPSVSDPDGTVDRYAWRLDDIPLPDDGPTLSHLFSDPGTFRLTVTVTDDRGATASATITVIVRPTGQNVAPTANFDPASIELVQGSTLTVAPNTSDADGSVVRYRWQFGDEAAFDGPSPQTHVFASPGDVVVTVTVFDDKGASGSARLLVHVLAAASDAPPTVVFSPSALRLDEGQQFRFDPRITDPDGEVVRAEWDFGDGTNISSLNAVTHAYADEGEYTLKVTAFDALGASGSGSVRVTVGNLSPLIKRLDRSRSFALAGQPLTLTPIIVDTDPLEGRWDFGDGMTEPGTTLDHTWNAVGRYDISFTVTDGDGGSAIVRRQIQVIPANDGPLTEVTISADLSCAVQYRGDTTPAFYGRSACGTFVAVTDAAGTRNYGPDYIPAGGFDRTFFTPVSQTTSGAGTTASPYAVDTVVDAGSELRVHQVDRYVVGENAYTTETTVEPRSRGLDVTVFYGADCFLGDSDTGFGERDNTTGTVTCRGIRTAPDGTDVPGDRSSSSSLSPPARTTCTTSSPVSGKRWPAVGRSRTT